MKPRRIACGVVCPACREVCVMAKKAPPTLSGAERWTCPRCDAVSPRTWWRLYFDRSARRPGPRPRRQG